MPSTSWNFWNLIKGTHVIYVLHDINNPRAVRRAAAESDDHEGVAP
jgi:hypothetical protein